MRWPEETVTDSCISEKHNSIEQRETQTVNNLADVKIPLLFKWGLSINVIFS